MYLGNSSLKHGRHVFIYCLVAALCFVFAASVFAVSAAPAPAPTATPTIAPSPVASPTPAPSPVEGPAPLSGDVIYRQHCADCHGDAGKGDGPKAASLANKPPDFTDVTHMRTRSPAQSFQTVTQGSTSKTMPSFEQALSNDERWAAVYYIISLTSNSQSIAAGQELFGANCVSCHGETGKGDGPEAASLAPKPSDFSDRAAMAAKSNQDLFDAIANGKGKMPAWKNKLTETNRWLIVDYIRSLSLAGIPIEATNGIIEGEVKNGTSGADAAKLASLTATLYTVENNIAQPAATATTDAQGKFRFEKLAIGPEHGYGVVVRYGEIDYPSTLLQFEPGKTTLTTSIIVYEMTASDADIGEMSTHLIMNINAGVFQIIELHVIQNKGDKTYLPAVGEGMRFFLPTGAADLSFDDPNIEQGAAKTADGFSARFAVSPSGYQLLFSYTIPFKPPSYSLSYKMPLPTAAFNALILDVGEQAKSDQLTASEPRETTRGRYLNLNGGPFDKGAQVNIDLTSIPTEATPSQPTAVPTAVPRAAMPEYAPWLVLAIAALGAALAVGYSLLRRRRRATAVEEPTPSVVEGPPVEPTEEEQGD